MLYRVEYLCDDGKWFVYINATFGRVWPAEKYARMEALNFSKDLKRYRICPVGTDVPVWQGGKYIESKEVTK